MPASIVTALVRGRILAAASALGALVLSAPPVLAADLYDDAPPPRVASAYEDPRYADIYGHHPVPHEPIYRDDYYRDTDRWAAPRRQACLAKDVISRRLERDGWGDFANPQVIDRRTATVDARRVNGRPFRLEVDRCTGEVLVTRPLDQRYGVYEDRYSATENGIRRRY